MKGSHDLLPLKWKSGEVSEVSQQDSLAAAFLTTEVDGDRFSNVTNSF